MKQIIVIGSTTIDHINRDQSIFTKAGGVTTYAGLTFYKHGLQVKIVSNIAKGDRSLLKVFENLGIEVINGETEITTKFTQTLQEGEVTQQGMLCCANPIVAEQVESFLEWGDHIHLGPLHPLDIDSEMIHLISQSHKFITLDIQGYTRKFGQGIIELEVSKELVAALSCAKIIKAESKELDLILKYYGIDEQGLLTKYNLDEILVTRGEYGGYVVSKGGDPVSYEAEQMAQITDTTGAGDVFFAAYLISHLYDHHGISQSFEYALQVTAQQIAGKYISEQLKSNFHTCSDVISNIK